MLVRLWDNMKQIQTKPPKIVFNVSYAQSVETKPKPVISQKIILNDPDNVQPAGDSRAEGGRDVQYLDRVR